MDDVEEFFVFEDLKYKHVIKNIIVPSVEAILANQLINLTTIFLPTNLTNLHEFLSPIY